MKCIFLRHGIAADRELWDGPDDGRPLTPEGVDRMKREARSLAGFLPPIDAIVSSPLLRAKQTAEILAREIKHQNGIAEDDRIVILSVRSLARILELHREAQTIVLVGHEPTMSATIGELIGGGRIELKKAAMACVELPERDVTKGELLWLLPPKAPLL